jgi:hypothetical protein
MNKATLSMNLLFITSPQEEKQHNDRVDRAARFQSTFTGPMMMQNAQPPLRSNDLLCCVVNKSPVSTAL